MFGRKRKFRKLIAEEVRYFRTDPDAKRGEQALINLTGRATYIDGVCTGLHIAQNIHDWEVYRPPVYGEVDTHIERGSYVGRMNRVSRDLLMDSVWRRFRVRPYVATRRWEKDWWLLFGIRVGHLSVHAGVSTSPRVL